MKAEYDFSKAERGKFHRLNLKLSLPVYLDTEVLNFIQKLARKRKTDVSSVVNHLLRSDMQLAEAMK